MIHTIPDCHSAESATKKTERKEIPTVELPVTDDSSAEKGRKRATAREVCGQTCLGLFFFSLWLACFLMVNAPLTISTFSFFISFKNACLKPLACLEASCPSLAKMDMNFPGGCADRVQRLCPTGPGSGARVPVPPPAAPAPGQGAGLGHHALLVEGVGKEAETFQFSLSSFIWKVIPGKKAGSLIPAYLHAASAHPSAPPQRVFPSSSGCCEA